MKCYIKELGIEQDRDCIKYVNNICTGIECLPLEYNGVNQIFYPIGKSDMLGKCYQGTKHDTIHQDTINKLVKELE